MLQVTCFDASDPLTVIYDFGPRLNQSVKHDVAVEVDDGDTGQTVTLLRQNPLTVKCQNFSFPNKQFDNVRMIELLNYFDVYLLPAFQTLVEHVVEKDCLCRVHELDF